MPTRFSFVVRAVPRTRHQLARRPWIRWAVAAVLATVVGWSVATKLGDVDRQRDAWGSRTPVVVAIVAAEAGQPLQFEVRDLPIAALPDGALGEVTPGTIARRAVAAGQVLTALDVSTSGPGGWLPAGWVQLTVPVDPLPALAPGAAVRVFADGVAIGDGQVVSRDEGSVSVGVPAEVAPAVAEAAAQRTAVIGALAGP